MKWIVLATVGVLSLALLVAHGTAEPKPDAPKAGAIFKSQDAIKIDGVLDEPAWKNAIQVDADYVWSKIGEKSKEPRMKAWYTWDDHYLYIAYETFDRNLIALGTGEKKGPKGN